MNRFSSFLAVFLTALSSAVQADGIRLNAEAYQSPTDYLREQVPATAATKIQLPQEPILNTLYAFDRELHASGMATFTAEQHEGFVRYESKMFDWEDEAVRMDVFFDEDRIACFESRPLIRCIAMIGYRKAAFSHEDLDAREFLFTQSEYTLERTDGDSLEVREFCFDQACYRVEK